MPLWYPRGYYNYRSSTAPRRIMPVQNTHGRRNSEQQQRLVVVALVLVVTVLAIKWRRMARYLGFPGQLYLERSTQAIQAACSRIEITREGR